MRCGVLYPARPLQSHVLFSPLVWNLMADFDTAWKGAIDAFFEPFMACFFGEAHREIKWARGFEMLDEG